MNNAIKIVAVNFLLFSVINANVYRFGEAIEAAFYTPYTRIVCLPDEFDGRLLRFGAFISTGFENQYLQPDRPNFDPYNKIIYEFGDKLQLSLDERNRLNGAYVIVEGVFSSQGEGSPEVGSVIVSYIQISVESGR